MLEVQRYNLYETEKQYIMPNFRFKHSYRHCEGAGCGKREVCAFHLALQEARELGLKKYDVIDRCHDGELYLRVRIEKPAGEGRRPGWPRPLKPNAGNPQKQQR